MSGEKNLLVRRYPNIPSQGELDVWVNERGQLITAEAYVDVLSDWIDVTEKVRGDLYLMDRIATEFANLDPNDEKPSEPEDLTG